MSRVIYETLKSACGPVFVAELHNGRNVAVVNVSLSSDEAMCITTVSKSHPGVDVVSGNVHFSEEILKMCCGQSVSVPFEQNGTDFSMSVWNELIKIPPGQVRSYSEVAALIGKPLAVRAVASACARNNVAVLVPCHRVVGASGHLTGYRWGIEIKKRLLNSEGVFIDA